MECLYIPELTEETDKIEVPQKEVDHVKALRLNSGEQVLAVNGKGLEALCEVRFKKGKPHLNVIGKSEGKQQKYITLAFGMILDKNRLEFLFEKCTELGVSEFQPLITNRTQRPKLNLDRAERKVIAAMKQSKRAVLPNLNEPVKLEDYLINQKGTLINTDYTGSDERILKENKAIIIIGPEGGFTPHEINLIQKKSKYTWRLSNNRLRTETAAMSAASFALNPE